LLRRLGLSLDERALHDNDILVRRSDAHAAAGALEALGYQPRGGRSIAAHLRSDFQLAYERQTASGVAVLDLHWAAFTPSLYPVDEALVWSRTETFEHRGQSFIVFDKPLTLVHLAAHYAQHRFTEARIVRQLAAGWNRWHSSIDHDDLRDLAHETGQTDALAYAFLVARADLEAQSPSLVSPVAQRLYRRFPSGRDDAPSPDRDYAGALAAMRLASARRWPAYIANLAFPPIETLSAITGRPIGPALYFEYAARPLRPPWRMLRRRWRS